MRDQITELRATLSASETAHAATRVRLAAVERELALAAAAPEPDPPEPAAVAEAPEPAVTEVPEPAAAEAPELAPADDPAAPEEPPPLAAASHQSLARIRRTLGELTTPADPSPPRSAPGRVAANLDAAAAALRERAARDPAPPPPRDREPAEEEDTSHLPPATPARPVPEALLALARQDPDAAARLLVALLPVQHVALSGPIDYDLTIAEAGTFAVSATPFTSSVTRLERPRPFWQRSFHARGGAVALIELLAGRRPLRRLRGPVRVIGRQPRARELLTGLWTAATAQAVLDAGARIPADALVPLLPHLVAPAWTAGHTFCVQIIIDHPWYIRSLDGDGVAVARTVPPGVPIDTTLQLSAGAFAASVAGRRLGATIASTSPATLARSRSCSAGCSARAAADDTRASQSCATSVAPCSAVREPCHHAPSRCLPRPASTSTSTPSTRCSTVHARSTSWRLGRRSSASRRWA